MKYGDQVELLMKKTMLMEKEIDSKIILCSILRYDMKEECIYLVLENDLLQNISLDAEYECKILMKEECSCIGTVKERYYNEYGKILKFQIKNGFYKINVKSVDKQMA